MWRPGPVQLRTVNRVRAGRQQLSADPAVCRRSPGRHVRGRGCVAVPEGCESGRIGTLGKRVWGNPPWVRIPLPPRWALWTDVRSFAKQGRRVAELGLHGLPGPPIGVDRLEHYGTVLDM